MGLLDEIRSDLVNASTDLSNTLRKAKILASAIGVPEFRQWVDFELGGYTDRDKVPSYRRFPANQLRPLPWSFSKRAKECGAAHIQLASAS